MGGATIGSGGGTNCSKGGYKSYVVYLISCGKGFKDCEYQNKFDSWCIVCSVIFKHFLVASAVASSMVCDALQLVNDFGVGLCNKRFRKI